MKLTNLKPALNRLRPALAPANLPDESRRLTPRPTWASWYKLQRWKRLRMDVLTRDLFRCQMCGKLGVDTSTLVADHKKPHRGRAELFWDMANVWTLCADPCHNSVKQREESASLGGVWD